MDEMGAYAKSDNRVPARDAAIPSQLSKVVMQAEMLRKQLEELQTRLAPLMGPDMPMNMVGESNAKQGPGCEMAEKLGHVVNMIDGGNLILANVMKRLEI